MEKVPQQITLTESFLMCSTEGNLMKCSNLTSNVILNQLCVLGNETDLLPVCLVKDGVYH